MHIRVAHDNDLMIQVGEGWVGWGVKKKKVNMINVCIMYELYLIIY